MNANMHALIIGRTRSGKSKLLQSIFTQTLLQQGTCAILEPHFEFSMDSLKDMIAAKMFKSQEAFYRLIYMDFNNGYYWPLNILAGDERKIRAYDEEEIETVVETALDIMTRIWPELNEAPQFTEFFTAFAHTLVVNFLPITAMYRLIVDDAYRANCMVRVQDKLALLVLRSYNSMKKDERLMATGSLRRRLYALCRHPALRYGLSQPNCIDFRYLMDQGISIIMNLGTLRTRPVKKMLGCILLVMLEQAALGRLSAEKVSKRPFRLLLDEWPAFAAQDQSLSDILSQTAKCQFNIALACQTTSQISAHGLMGAMENCRQLCIFGVGVGSAKDLAETMAQTNALVVKEEALTSTQHNLYEHYQEQIREVMEQLRDQSAQHFAYQELADNGKIKSTRYLKAPYIKSHHVADKDLRYVLDTYKRGYQLSPEQAKPKFDELFDALVADVRADGDNIFQAMDREAAEQFLG